jgi:hypothetical protein
VTDPNRQQERRREQGTTPRRGDRLGADSSVSRRIEAYAPVPTSAEPWSRREAAGVA